MSQNTKKYFLRNKETAKVVCWSISEILEEVNRDRSDTWSDYNEADWKDGLTNWTEYEIVDKCPKCNSNQFGFHKIKRGDPTLTDDTFELWICRNCNYQSFSNISGLV